MYFLNWIQAMDNRSAMVIKISYSSSTNYNWVMTKALIQIVIISSLDLTIESTSFQPWNVAEEAALVNFGVSSLVCEEEGPNRNRFDGDCCTGPPSLGPPNPNRRLAGVHGVAGCHCSRSWYRCCRFGWSQLYQSSLRWSTNWLA